MVVPVGTAINAYNNAATALGGMGAPQSGDAVGGASFGEMLQSAVSGAIDTMHKGEDISAQGLVGKASASDVVNAVSQAEVTLNEVTAIRDKVVSAYEDILKMPI